MGYKARQSRYSDLKDEVPPGGVFENVAQSKKPDSQKLPFSCKYVDFKCNKKNHSLYLKENQWYFSVFGVGTARFQEVFNTF